MLTDIELKNIRERAGRAIPGPWFANMLGGGKGGPNHYNVTSAGLADDETIFIIAHCYPVPKGSSRAGWNAHFIASARQDVVALLDHIDELAQEAK